jgi:hypothetical protein
LSFLSADFTQTVPPPHYHLLIQQKYKLMELPFYFTLSVRERHSLLSRLTKHYQALIREFEKEQDLYKDFLKPNY